MEKNRLYFGDNLDVLRKYIPSESVDLVYLDPPFNSNRNYSVIFNKHGANEDAASAQIEAFEDTWRWTHVTDEQYMEFVQNAPGPASDALVAFRTLLGENDAMAYLVNMAPRLVELHRVLKATGSIYLHCDPTMSHYLKILLDAIFDPRNFRSEIIWKRTTAHNSAKRYGPVHDVILYYAKNATQVQWNRTYQTYDSGYVASKYRHTDGSGQGPYRLSDMTGSGTRNGESGKPWRGFNPTSIGRHWAISIYCVNKYRQLTGTELNGLPTLQDRLEALDSVGLIQWPDKDGGRPEHKRYLSDMPGVALQDVWTDIDPINSRAAERLGYPTQKPLALMERILNASSVPGDVVLDPFCGCGTTVDAAQKLGRKWMGIDITYISVDLIIKRLQHTYGDEIRDTFEVSGIPSDLAAAQAMFDQSAFEFERWAASLVGAQPNQKQVGDRGIDGVARFVLDKTGKNVGRILVSVKGGKTLTPSMVRDLAGTVEREKAEMGVLVTLVPATRGVQEAIDHGGTYVYPANGQVFPRLQHITIKELLQGKTLRRPPMLRPYIEAKRQTVSPDHQPELGF